MSGWAHHHTWMASHVGWHGYVNGQALSCAPLSFDTNWNDHTPAQKCRKIEPKAWRWRQLPTYQPNNCCIHFWNIIKFTTCFRLFQYSRSLSESRDPVFQRQPMSPWAAGYPTEVASNSTWHSPKIRSRNRWQGLVLGSSWNHSNGIPMLTCSFENSFADEMIMMWLWCIEHPIFRSTHILI